MADARALLRAKRQEVRITHPYATYSSTGQLRCTICSTTVKQASMWEGHLGSKSHRVAVMKLREQEERRRAEEAALKRKAEELEEDEMDVDTKKRRVSDEEDEDEDMQQPTTTASAVPKGLPADFFSDPSKAPVLDDGDEDSDEDDASAPAQPLQPPKEKTQIDLEWEQFQATVVRNNATEEDANEARQETFQRATVMAEPELVPEANEGFPSTVTNGDGAPVQEEEPKEETKQ